MVRFFWLPLVFAACASVPPESWPESWPELVPVEAPSDPKEPVTVDAAAAFAVAHNPNLVALRASLGVNDARVVAAGVWPDPGLDLGIVAPASSSEGLGLEAGIHWELSALWMTAPAVDMASSEADAARWQVRWEEQAVIADVRLQASRLQVTDAQVVVADEAAAGAAALVDDARAAADRGDITLDTLTLRFTALQDARAQVAGLNRAHDDARRALCADLGLTPACVLVVRAPGAPPQNTPALSDLMTIALAQRVDLRALRAAWQGNEASLRQGLLARFPRVDVAVNGGQDPGRYTWGGASVGVSIPIFDGGRGTRAIAVATRGQLKAELEARVFDIRRVLGDALAVIEFARRERTLLQLLVPDLTSSEAALAAARDRGDATAAAWAEARSQLLDTRLRLLEVGASEREAFIALEAATGTAALRTTP